jgi:MYXO-CTERM domain-containing protein
MRISIGIAVVVALVLVAGSPARGEVVWHDPWLNWDFINTLGTTVNDFAVIVDASGWVPDEQWSVPFTNFATYEYDWDGDGTVDDTMCKWTGAEVAANAVAHGGLYMLGSGRVLDAFWTLDCNKIGPSTAITYERTEIRGDPEVHMHLQIAPGYFEDTSNPNYPDAEAGWTQIRTFVNIPASELGLEDLTRELDLSDLAAYEVQPKNGLTGAPILLGDIIWGDCASFFDIFLAEIDPEYASPGYEALLHAEVVNQGNVVGEFWNLNPQSPEPASMSLLVLGGLAMLRRRRR